MSHFPLFAELSGQPCLVVGGGEVAARKIRRLLQAGADVVVNAPELCAELAGRLVAGEIRHAPGGFEPALVDEALLVIAATSDRAVNRRVAKAAERARRLCNVVDDGELSSCILPAVVDRSPVTIAVGTAGTSPVLARRLRQDIERWLPARIGELAAWAGGWRDAVRSRIRTHAGRLRFWESVFDGDAARDVLAGDRGGADARMRAALEAGAAAMSARGVAWFVGAGPGDPGLMTARGMQLLQRADVVLYDRLVPAEILDLARRDARLIGVGKSPEGPRTAQAFINRQLVELVAAGHRVCRLKGGDPFIFGRGGEEIDKLAQKRIPFQVVPGITAASGASCYAGIPLTHRDVAHSCVFVTGHLRDGTLDLDWSALARPGQTLVFYMGVGQLAEICRELANHGLSADMPAAVVENATCPAQRVVTGTLQTLAHVAKAAGTKPPALIIVGEVVRLRRRLEQSVSAKRTKPMVETIL